MTETNPLKARATLRLARMAVICGILSSAGAGRAEQGASGQFVGSMSCSTSMCHGGASDKSRQYTVWSKQDAHTRAYATLTTARAARVSESLKLGDATKSARCTSCHAPMAEVTAQPAGGGPHAGEAVSCENCHGAADGWLRAHTRMDYSHRDRVQAGMRDLKNLYVRANSCVACHETVERDLIAAGHPELIFELDGQAVSEPRHWREKGDYQGPQAWLVGQAAALREMSWQLSGERAFDERVANRWQGLGWMLQKVGGVAGSEASLPAKVTSVNSENVSQMLAAADRLAKSAAELSWSEKETMECLGKLARSAADFRDRDVPQAVQARRAERLALAVDRLTVSLDKAAAERLDPEVKGIFRLAQSLADFDPIAFARALDKLAAKL